MEARDLASIAHGPSLGVLRRHQQVPLDPQPLIGTANVSALTFSPTQASHQH